MTEESKSSAIGTGCSKIVGAGFVGLMLVTFRVCVKNADTLAKPLLRSSDEIVEHMFSNGSRLSAKAYAHSDHAKTENQNEVEVYWETLMDMAPGEATRTALQHLQAADIRIRQNADSMRLEQLNMPLMAPYKWIVYKEMYADTARWGTPLSDLVDTMRVTWPDHEEAWDRTELLHLAESLLDKSDDVFDFLLDKLIQVSDSNNIRTTAQSSSSAYKFFYPYHEAIIDEICKRSPRVSEDGTLLLLPTQ